MNLINFVVKEIIEEKYDKLYKLYGMTNEELQEEKLKDFSWYEKLSHNGCRQKYSYVDIGGVSTKYDFFDLDENEKPYKIGYKGMH